MDLLQPPQDLSQTRPKRVQVPWTSLLLTLRDQSQLMPLDTSYRQLKKSLLIESTAERDSSWFTGKAMTKLKPLGNSLKLSKESETISGPTSLIHTMKQFYLLSLGYTMIHGLHELSKHPNMNHFPLNLTLKDFGIQSKTQTILREASSILPPLNKSKMEIKQTLFFSFLLRGM